MCQQQICYSKYLEHVNNIHKWPPLVYKKRLDLSFYVTEDLNPLDMVWKARRISAFDKTFFEVGMIKNSLVYRWIYLLGFSEEAKNFQYKATLIDDKTEYKISFEEQVRPMTENYEFIVESQNAFVVPLATCKKYKKDNVDEVQYEIELTEKSDEKVLEEKSNRKCVICLDQDSTMALTGCGHVVSCSECAPRLPEECPICRVPKIGTLKIFYP